MPPRNKKPSPKVSMVLALLQEADSEAFRASVAPSCGRAIHSTTIAAEKYGRGQEGLRQIKKPSAELFSVSNRAGKMLHKGMEHALKKCGAKSITD